MASANGHQNGGIPATESPPATFYPATGGTGLARFLEDAGCGDELRPTLLEPVRDADHRGGVIVHRVEDHP